MHQVVLIPSFNQVVPVYVVHTNAFACRFSHLQLACKVQFVAQAKSSPRQLFTLCGSAMEQVKYKERRDLRKSDSKRAMEPPLRHPLSLSTVLPNSNSTQA